MGECIGVLWCYMIIGEIVYVYVFDLGVGMFDFLDEFL